MTELIAGEHLYAVGRLVGPDGTLFAHASTTCLVFDVVAPGVAEPTNGK